MLTALGAISLLLHASGAQADPGPTKAQLREIIEDTIAEEAGSNTICAVSLLDLDGDGFQEAVFTFMVGSHGSQARAIRWMGEKPVVLFAEGSDTPNTTFVRVRGIPTIVLERSDYEPNYVTGKRTQQLYPWNGATFAHAPADDCLLQDLSVTAEDGTAVLQASDAHCQPPREPIPDTGCTEL